jgi:hypothetical protein
MDYVKYALDQIMEKWYRDFTESQWQLLLQAGTKPMIDKIRAVLQRCDNGGASIVYIPTADYFECTLWKDSYLEGIDLHTLLEASGLNIIKLFAKNNQLVIHVGIK